MAFKGLIRPFESLIRPQGHFVTQKSLSGVVDPGANLRDFSVRGSA